MLDQNRCAANWKAKLADIVVDIDRDFMPKPAIVALCAKLRRTIGPALVGVVAVQQYTVFRYYCTFCERVS